MLTELHFPIGKIFNKKKLYNLESNDVTEEGLLLLEHVQRRKSLCDRIKIAVRNVRRKQLIGGNSYLKNQKYRKFVYNYLYWWTDELKHTNWTTKPTNVIHEILSYIS